MSAMRTRLTVSGCLLLSAVSLSSIALAQTGWQRTYGEPYYPEWGSSVQQTADGGYVIAGVFYPFGTGDADVWLIKTDAQGDTLWTRTFGGDSGDAGYSVRQTTDGGYIVAGSTWSFGAGHYDIYLVKTNATGDTLWTRTYGGVETELGHSVQQTTDGGYIIAGGASSFGAGRSDFYLVKTNARGDTLWTRTYGGPEHEEGYSVQQTSDGGYIVAGHTTSFGAGQDDVYLVKTNASGDTLWTRTCGGPEDDEGRSVQQTTDGGYIIAGTTQTPDAEDDVYLVRTDADGNTLWTRTYGGADYDEGSSVEQTTDGGYIVAGNTDSYDAGRGYLVKTNAQGDTLLTRIYGGAAHSVRQTTDGGYIIMGSYLGDVCLIKTNADPDVGRVAILSPPGIVDSGQVYVPSVIVRNFGLSRAVFPVTMSIGTAYAQTVQETLASEISDTVVFPVWTAGPVGTLAVTCFTSLTGDKDPRNDTIRDSVQVLPEPVHDVGAVAIVSPTGSVRAGDTVIPRARIRNFGNRQERYFDVRFRIGASYNEKVNVADALPAGSTAEVAFPPWVAEAGNWAVSCSTMLASDVDSANDKASASVLVVPQSLSIAPDQSDRIEAGKSKTYRFRAVIAGDTGGIVAVERPTSPQGWSVRLCDVTSETDLTDTDGDGTPDLGYVAPGESGWFSLEVTAPSKTQGDTASLGQVTFLVAGHVGDRPDIADTAALTLTLVPELSIHNFPNPFTDHTAFVVGLPDDGKASLTVYTRDGTRVCRVLANSDLTAGVHLVPWNGVNDHGRALAPGTYEYLLDYVHAGKTDRIRKRLVLTRQ
jgi:hypothetical protein